MTIKDASLWEVVGKMLRKLGYEPAFALKGQEALEMYARAQEAGEP
jgi:CheY-like chemotaxis protein